jgi:hypothetical protein
VSTRSAVARRRRVTARLAERLASKSHRPGTPTEVRPAATRRRAPNVPPGRWLPRVAPRDLRHRLPHVLPGNSGVGLISWVRRTMRVTPFHRRGAPRRQRRRVFYSPALLPLLCLAVVTILMSSTLAYMAFSRGAQGWGARSADATSAAQPTQAIVVRGAPGTATAPVVRPAYVMGAWVSDSAPPPTGSIQVYVRVTDYVSLLPAAGVPVALQVQFTCSVAYSAQPFGPTPTDTDGIASFTVTFSGLQPGQPVCVTASATAAGKTYTAATTFAPT